METRQQLVEDAKVLRRRARRAENAIERAALLRAAGWLIRLARLIA